MSETPGSPEYYTPPAGAEPPEVPEPPSISDAAAQWDKAQASGSQPAEYAAQHAQAHGYVPVPGQVYAPPPPTSGHQGLAITSLVLGIIAFFTGWIPVWGLVVGGLAVVLGAVAVAKKQPKGLAISGIITGALAAATSVVVLIVVIMNSTHSPGSIDTSFDYSFGSPQTTLGPSPVDGGLAVTEQAFAPVSYDETMTWFVVVLSNPSDKAYYAQQVTVNALDASGAVIDTVQIAQGIAPGESALTGSFAELGGAQVASLEVIGPGVDALSSEPVPALAVSQLTVSSDDSFTTVSGTVESPTADLTYGAAVNVVARDANGTIIGAAPGYADAISKGESSSFAAIFYDVMPDDTTYVAYASAY